jgi:hypothetical protein
VGRQPCALDLVVIHQSRDHCCRPVLRQLHVVGVCTSAAGRIGPRKPGNLCPRLPYIPPTCLSSPRPFNASAAGNAARDPSAS